MLLTTFVPQQQAGEQPPEGFAFVVQDGEHVLQDGNRVIAPVEE